MELGVSRQDLEPPEVPTHGHGGEKGATGFFGLNNLVLPELRGWSKGARCFFFFFFCGLF